MDIETLIKNYYQERNIDCPNMYCKDCGKLLIYDNASISFQKRNGQSKDTHKGDIVSCGNTFLSTKEYNGITYHLCRCKECVGKKYPEIYNVKFLYSAKFAKYSQYAYDVPEEEFKKYTKERQSLTKNKMIKKYGEEVGIEKWNAYRQKQSITNTFEYKHEKYGMPLEDFHDYNKSRACTKELFIQRHGEAEGMQKWNAYCERQRYTTSLEYFIERYGEEIGNEKYFIFDNERISFGGASKMATKFFNELSKNEIFNNHEIYYSEYNHEYNVKGYRLDFYDKTLNLVIEFYGDKWHANPILYKENDIIHLKQDNLAGNIWKHDEYRKNLIINELHCIFLIIWEHDIRNKFEKSKTIHNIIDIIKSKNMEFYGNTIK